MRVATLLLIASAAIMSAGCSTNYYAIVTKDGAPLYDDDDRSAVIGHLSRLDDGYLGHSKPDDDPVAIKIDGRKGYANRKDLRIFATHNDRLSIEEGTFRARRDVDLDGRDWPEEKKRAIREDRIENGMTREMVELSWGRPSSIGGLPEGGQRWRYDSTEYDVVHGSDTIYNPGGWRSYGGVGFYGYHRPWRRGWGYGWGPSFGMAYEWPSYDHVYTRTYIPRTVRRSVTFDGEGRVVGFDSRGE